MCDVREGSFADVPRFVVVENGINAWSVRCKRCKVEIRCPQLPAPMALWLIKGFADFHAQWCGNPKPEPDPKPKPTWDRPRHANGKFKKRRRPAAAPKPS